MGNRDAMVRACAATLAATAWTRSDLSLSTVRSGDTTLLERALASGAQLISTEFPSVGMSARYGTDFVARLPEGLPARCNPVNAPRNCRDERLER